ncbi:MAG: hypothetical protein U0514_04350 [Candidatus Andersenbacteria bacterium]
MTLPRPLEIILAVVALALMANSIARFAGTRTRPQRRAPGRLAAGLGRRGHLALFPEVPHDVSVRLGLGVNLAHSSLQGLSRLFYK